MAYDRYKQSKTQRKVYSYDDEKQKDGDDITNVISGLDKYISEFTKGERESKMQGNRAYELHPSSFPYCALQQVHEIFKNGGIPTTQKIDYYGSYYTGLGSFKHELMQDWLGKGKQIVGDWVCKKHNRKKKPCKGERKFCVELPCPKCKGEMEYRELGIKYGKHTHGHLDGIFLYKGKYYIIDYKTTGQFKLFQHKSGRKVEYPMKANKAQIESYCFHPDTFIVTDKGRVKISELVNRVEAGEKFKALSYNHTSQESEFKPVSKVWSKPTTDNMLEIEYEGGSIKVTENHEVWSVTRGCYVKAIDLTEDDEILVNT